VPQPQTTQYIGNSYVLNCNFIEEQNENCWRVSHLIYWTHELINFNKLYRMIQGTKSLTFWNLALKHIQLVPNTLQLETWHQNLVHCAERPIVTQLWDPRTVECSVHYQEPWEIPNISKYILIEGPKAAHSVQ